MTKEQINNLLLKGRFPETTAQRELIETHISWVIVCDAHVYKIKKPVHYSFLDFSTAEQRKHYCQREIDLNRRLTDKVYISVQSICEWQGVYSIGGTEGTIIDYAVKMHKLDRAKQMDILLSAHLVTALHIQQLAEKIAFFHKSTTIIIKKDFMDLKEKFSDLETEKEFLGRQLGVKYADSINFAIAGSNAFMNSNQSLLAARKDAGFFRDCHGDLHSRNIFLLPEPIPFDCIEFNDDLRQIDVLNEIAFLCMDLDAFGRQDLSALFIDYYNEFFPVMKTKADRSLFIYYKSYRANIRAKVNSLRAKSATEETEKAKALSAADKYIILMETYLRTIV